MLKMCCPSGGGGGAGRRRLDARRAERERRPGRGAGAIPRRGRVEVRTRRGMMLKQYDTFKPSGLGGGRRGDAPGGARGRSVKGGRAVVRTLRTLRRAKMPYNRAPIIIN